jgi:hypothetical protein
MRRALELALVACVSVLASCGSDTEEVPAACTEGADAVRKALHAAPGPVRLDRVRLSDCLVEESDAGTAQAVGASYVEAAARLASEARRRPAGRAPLELGYLVGAARRGASDQGVHSELLRRLDQELTRVDTRADAFQRGLRAASREG